MVVCLPNAMLWRRNTTVCFGQTVMASCMVFGSKKNAMMSQKWQPVCVFTQIQGEVSYEDQTYDSFRAGYSISEHRASFFQQRKLQAGRFSLPKLQTKTSCGLFLIMTTDEIFRAEKYSLTQWQQDKRVQVRNIKAWTQVVILQRAYTKTNKKVYEGKNSYYKFDNEMAEKFSEE